MDYAKDIDKVVALTENLEVLYVEDDVSVSLKTTELLKNFFKKITVAVDGQDGLEKYMLNRYDLVITDIKMPKKDGIEMIQAIRQLKPNQNIIVTSAYNDSDRLLELISLEISSFLLKPLDANKFLKTIFAEATKINQKQIAQANELDKTKYAQMGEMIDSIAHQWKQPLSAISLMAQSVNYKIEFGTQIPMEDIYEINTKIRAQINHLTNTIDSFRRFFRPVQELDTIPFSFVMNDVDNIMRNTLLINNIEVELKDEENLNVRCIRNEFIHILINLINNSKDAFIENQIEIRKMVFLISKDSDKKVIKIDVIDNAGGIPEINLSNIFKQHFTTKEHINGTGIGLFLSKQILEKIGGTLEATNKETQDGKGVCFTISIPI